VIDFKMHGENLKLVRNTILPHKWRFHARCDANCKVVEVKFWDLSAASQSM